MTNRAWGLLTGAADSAVQCHSAAMPPRLPPLLPSSLLPSHPELLYSPPLPLSVQWLVWVQLAGTMQAARICFLHLCPSPAFSEQAAQGPLRRMASSAEALRVLLPTPGPLAGDGTWFFLVSGMCKGASFPNNQPHGSVQQALACAAALGGTLPH